MAAAFVCPLDVVKTRLQVARAGAGAAGYDTLRGSLATVVREEGVRGLYRGLGPTLMALLPNWAVYFSVYERLKERLRRDAAARPLDRHEQRLPRAARGHGGGARAGAGMRSAGCRAERRSERHQRDLCGFSNPK